MEAAAMEAAAVTEGMGVAMEEAAATEDMVVDTEEAAATEGMGVDTGEAAATEEVVEDMEVAVIMVMAATAVTLSMTTAINAHVVSLADGHLSWRLMELLSFYLTQTYSKNFKFNFF
jgi:hypothetical protein